MVGVDPDIVVPTWAHHLASTAIGYGGVVPARGLPPLGDLTDSTAVVAVVAVVGVVWVG